MIFFFFNQYFERIFLFIDHSIVSGTQTGVNFARNSLEKVST